VRRQALPEQVASAAQPCPDRPGPQAQTPGDLGVEGVVLIAEHASADAHDQPLMPRHQQSEGLGLTGRHLANNLGIRRHGIGPFIP